MNNRETWLLKAKDLLINSVFKSKGVGVPDNIRISCGLPSRNAFSRRSKRVGECWDSLASKDNHFEIFISPTVAEGREVLGILAHEIIHACVGIAEGHRGRFRQVALNIGLEGKMTATTTGLSLDGIFTNLLEELGDYPHAVLDKTKSGIKKQPTRLIRLRCKHCGYTIRTTKKWIEISLPKCACTNESFTNDTPSDTNEDEGSGE